MPPVRPFSCAAPLGCAQLELHIRTYVATQFNFVVSIANNMKAVFLLQTLHTVYNVGRLLLVLSAFIQTPTTNAHLSALPHS